MTFYTDLKQVFNTEKTILAIFGIYPDRNEKCLSSLFRIFRSLTLLHPGCFLLLAPLVFRIIIQENEMIVITDIFYMLTTVIAYWNKVLWFIRNNKKLIAIEDYLDAFLMYKNMRDGDDAYLITSLNLLGTMKLFFRITIVGVVVFYGMLPKLDGRFLPLYSWYPIDVNRWYYFVYVQQIFSLSLVACSNSSMDILCCTHMTLASGYFWILKRKLRRIDYHIREESNEGLKDCVELHKHLIELVEIIEEMFSMGIFVQFFCSMGVICLTCFQMLVVSPHSAQFLCLIIYLSCMMCQVIMYCWYGNEIIHESAGIGGACYNSNWYEGSEEQKKILFLVMERSKRQITLTAGKLFILSLPSLVVILKSSYSYFAVLRQVYQDVDIK